MEILTESLEVDKEVNKDIEEIFKRKEDNREDNLNKICIKDKARWEVE